MGFLSKIGNTISGSVSGMKSNIGSSTSSVMGGLTNQIKENFSAKSLGDMANNIVGGIFNKTLSSLKDGVIQGIMNSTGNRIGTNGLNLGYEGNFFNEDIDLYSLLGYTTFTDKYTTGDKTVFDTVTQNKNSDIRELYRTKEYHEDAQKRISDEKIAHSTNWHQELSLPNWDYAAFINERSIWQKGLTSPFGEPGYFYFKIFFKFDTQFGLLGGVLNNVDGGVCAHNTAMKYLNYLSMDKYYESLLPEERMVALRKFVRILSYINCNAPWFFRSVRGLDKAGNPITGDFSKERSIEIECNIDAIDMRLTTLLDLYKFIVYDDYSNKEVIPENLRKFDICILIFGSPIKTLHTALINSKLPYKTVVPHREGFKNLMSYKIYEFNGCEISTESIGAMTPGDMNNETPFNIGKGVIKINYDRCTTHTSNETNGILFGSTGFYFDYDMAILSNSSNSNSSNSEWTNNIINFFGNLDLGSDYATKDKLYQARVNEFIKKYDSPRDYVDAAEELTKNNLAKISRYGLGNLYGEDNAPTLPPSSVYPNGQTTEYFQAKIKHLHNRQNAIAQYGEGLLARMLSSSMSPYASLGYLEGYKERGPGSEWFKYKLDKLTSNFEHLWTTAPHDHKIAGHSISQRRFNKSGYVSNQETQDSLAGIDQANSLNSYALRDKMKQSMQNLTKRAAMGEYVGPGSEAYNEKLSALKSGSHEYTTVPHARTNKSSE